MRCYEETNGCFNYQHETTGTCHKSATGQVESMKLDLGAIKMAEYGCQLMIHANSANAARFHSSPVEQKRPSII